MSHKASLALLALAAVAAAAAGCARTHGPGLARGEQVFDTCAPCHGAAGHGNAAIGAPAIAGLPEWYVAAQLVKFKSSMRGAHPDDAAGQRMRPLARALYREGDVASAARYVATLTPQKPVHTLTGGNAAGGEARYSGICVTCHGSSAEGNEALGAPPLAHQADWYMYAQLVKYKNGQRGAHPDDVSGGQMAAMAQTLEDSTAMMDVIAHIRTLQK